MLWLYPKTQLRKVLASELVTLKFVYIHFLPNKDSI
jgi:hypothetical protein